MNREYTVTAGIEGSGWKDGDTFDTLEEARERYELELREAPDPHRYRKVTLEEWDREYEDGDIIEERLVRTICEARV